MLLDVDLHGFRNVHRSEMRRRSTGHSFAVYMHTRSRLAVYPQLRNGRSDCGSYPAKTSEQRCAAIRQAERVANVESERHDISLGHGWMASRIDRIMMEHFIVQHPAAA